MVMPLAQEVAERFPQALETDTAFMYLAQMYRPDFRTINDFRKENTEEIEGYFVSIIKICQGLGMVKIGSLSIDGSKIKANASSKLKQRQGRIPEMA